MGYDLNMNIIGWCKVVKKVLIYHPIIVHAFQGAEGLNNSKHKLIVYISIKDYSYTRRRHKARRDTESVDKDVYKYVTPVKSCTIEFL